MSRLLINLDKIVHNMQVVKNATDKCGVDLLVVTKVCASNPIISNKILANGIKSIGDSHVDSLKNIPGRFHRTALQCPISSAEEMEHVDFVYVSEIETIKRLVSLFSSMPFQLVVPVEVGDMRDGVPQSQLCDFVKKALAIGIQKKIGFSMNYGCLKKTRPDLESVETFCQCVQDVCQRLELRPTLISLGGSTLWSLIKQMRIPSCVDQVRIGETIFLGYDPGLKQFIKGLHADAFVFESEIIEIKEKMFDDKDAGHMEKKLKSSLQKRAVLDFGYTTCSDSGLIPFLEGVKIDGASQDQTVIFFDEKNLREIRVGDKIYFLLKYKSLAQLMNSARIDKKFIGNNALATFPRENEAIS